MSLSCLRLLSIHARLQISQRGSGIWQENYPGHRQIHNGFMIDKASFSLIEAFFAAPSVPRLLLSLIVVTTFAYEVLD